MDRYPRSDSIVQGRSGLQTYMAQVYGWMTVGLLLTAFIAWFAANTPAVMMFVFSSKITFFGLIIAQLGLVFVLSGMVAWWAVWPLGIGALAGGLVGPTVARRTNPKVLRPLVAACGYVLAVWLVVNR